MRRLRPLLAPALLALLVAGAPFVPAPPALESPAPSAPAATGIRYDDIGFAQVTAQATAWPDPDLTYFFHNETADIAGDGEEQAFRDAFALWAAVTPLTFTEVSTSGAADIVILFGAGNHGDGYPFDGFNGVLAHAFYPPPNGSFAGDAHFDDAETWTTSTRSSSAQPIDLVTVAAHEFGHSLGLDHTNVSSALMAPYYTGSHRFLSQNDIDAIQALYGDGSGGGGGGTPSVSIADKSIVEGDSGTKSVRLRLTLSEAAAGQVTVRLTTSNGSATAPGDYSTKNVTVRFKAGKTAKNVAIKITGDTVAESTETFTVTLSSPNGVTIADGTATVTILDND